MKYFDLITRLPLPTSDQTARFAAHVAENHSWYKHLPFFPPGAGFVLFLNPHAGYGVRETDGEFSVYSIEKGHYCEHHSRLSTDDYLERFGHWDYWVDDNPRDIEPQEGPWIYGPDGGQRNLLPSDVKQQWKCRLTAFLRPSSAMFRLRPRELYTECETFLGQAHPSAFFRVWTVFRRKSANPDGDASRYNDLASKIKYGSDLIEDISPVYSFLEAEAGVQRKRLHDLLNEIRGFCAFIE